MSTIIPEGEIFTCLFNLGGYFKKWYKKSGEKKACNTENRNDRGRGKTISLAGTKEGKEK